MRPIFQTFIECHWHRSYISIHCNFRMFLKINIPHRARKKLQSCIRRQFLGTILCFLVQCPYRADLGERGRWHWNQMRGQEAPLLCSPLWWKYPLCNAMLCTWLLYPPMCGRCVKLAAQYRTPACNQHRPQSSIYQCPTQLLSPPLGINKCASSPANKNYSLWTLHRILNVRSCLR